MDQIKKGLFVYYDASQVMKNPKTNGVLRKIMGQVSALNCEGKTQCELLVIPRPDVNRVKLFLTYLFCDQYREYYPQMSKCDYLYFRRFIPANIGLLKLLKRLKAGKGPRIFYEFPTFPYDKEHRTVVMRVLLLIDKLFRNRLKKYVDYAVVIGEGHDPFGIPGISMENGIRCELIRPSAGLASMDAYHMITVANFQFYHGCDRMIKGLKEYYENDPEKKVYFHLVGPENEESVKYKKLIEEYGLSEYILLHGARHGEDLDDLYDHAHIGIGTLGYYRIGLDKMDTSLKSKEYLARGIPFVSSTPFCPLPDAEFIFYVPNDDSAIDVKKIVAFLDELYERHTIKEWSGLIRDVAMERCDMSVTMRPVIQRIIGEM